MIDKYEFGGDLTIFGSDREIEFSFYAGQLYIHISYQNGDNCQFGVSQDKSVEVMTEIRDWLAKKIEEASS